MQFPYLSHFVRYTITKNFTGKHRLGHKPTDTGTSFEGQSKSLHFIVCNWRSFKQTKRKSAGTCIETYLTWWTGLSIVTRKLTSLRRFLIREEAKFWLPKTHIEVVYKLLHFSEVVVVPINKVTNKHSTLQSPDPDKNTHTPSWFLLVTFKASLRQLLRVSKHCCTVGNITAREICTLRTQVCLSKFLAILWNSVCISHHQWSLYFLPFTALFRCNKFPSEGVGQWKHCDSLVSSSLCFLNIMTVSRANR